MYKLQGRASPPAAPPTSGLVGILKTTSRNPDFVKGSVLQIDQVARVQDISQNRYS